ncbi:hypothetical protein WM43_14240 [Aeromonas veronii]|uniref:Uncharacterized protein n=1 Tax=Aeromonas veronii TaxID=654 RepID=A0AAC9B9R4_AERVE|nr:hypothetical protein WM43_14240 [Aeromonas veronii]RDD51697.1 hypothetical protein ASJ36_02060 [Aeromonas sp. ARM81]TNI93143.1 hypothetical protein CF114_18630 [Aeromonas veronii]
MTERKMLVCVEAGLGVARGQEYPVLGENGSVWEILLGGEYRKVNKRSGRVQGWKTGPRFQAYSSDSLA